MARYIDADKFMERLKASPAFSNMGMDGYFLLDVVEELLKKFPAADVVPKSEVAREIMQEVRQALLNMVLANSMGKAYDIEKRFAEIEKKYTEE